MASVVLIFCLFVLCCSATQNEGPVLRSQNDDVIRATVGSDVTLICETDVNTYGVVWYFNNEPVTRGDVNVTAQRGTLTLSSLKLTDSGWYTCAADDQFGRDEKDFLLLVGVSSADSEAITFNSSVYTVPVGSRVELPCHFTAVPQPTIQWFQLTDQGSSEITGNEADYTIDNVTQSLIMFGPSQAETLTFYCTAQNMFDEAPQRRNVTVEFFNYDQASVSTSFLLSEQGTQSLVISEGEAPDLDCLSNPTNYTVTWTRNLDSNPDTIRQQNALPFSGSAAGYYCCRVTGPGLELREAFFCITVLNTSNSFPRLSTLASNVTLPANTGRKVNLVCRGYTGSTFAPPTVELYSLNSTAVMSSSLSDSVNYMYLIDDVNGTGCTSAPCSTTYMCSGTNLASNVSAEVTVNSIAVCQGANALVGGNPNGSNSNSSWSGTDTGAWIETIQDETVFVLDYNSTDEDMPSFSQTMDIPDNSIVFSINMSGRVRQVGSANFSATVQLLSDGKDISHLCPYLTHPYPTLPSWQWIACKASPKSTSNLTVVLTVVRNGESQLGGGTAYFDDLCVTMDIQGPGGLSATDKYIIIGVSGACGVLLILIIMVLCCACCCCCGKRKGDVKMMKKMSTLIKKKRPSTVTHELGRTDGRYTHKPEAQQAPTTQADTYMVADAQVLDSYIDPESYAYTRGQPPAKVPPVLIEHLNQSSTPGEATNSSNKENGLYTSLKREELDQNNLYMTPSNCSTSSLNKLVEGETEGRQYVNIDGGTSSKYLTLVTQGSHKSEELIKASSSVGSRSPSPSYPPPPPPSQHRTRENGRRADSSPIVPVRSTSMDRMRSTSPLVPSSLSPEVPEQQIYENSQEAILSASPMFNGAAKTTSSHQLLPGISVSPPPTSDIQATNQKIYENSQEFFLMDDSDEDDGYENDLPGLHR